MSEKNAYFIIGCNGAGKTTFYYNNVKPNLNFSELKYINADEIAKDFELNGLDKEKAIRKSGSLAMKYLIDEVNDNNSFIMESLLTSNDTINLFKELKQKGYQVNATFLGCENVDTNIKNVDIRRKEGGHYMSPGVIEERYFKTFNMLKENIEIFDSISLFDNSIFGEEPTFIAKLKNGVIQVLNEDTKEINWFNENLSQIIDNKQSLEEAKDTIKKHQKTLSNSQSLEQ